eukprot:6205616-Pleurochrysis_carterae.AAC.2
MPCRALPCTAVLGGATKRLDCILSRRRAVARMQRAPERRKQPTAIRVFASTQDFLSFCSPEPGSLRFTRNAPTSMRAIIKRPESELGNHE